MARVFSGAVADLVVRFVAIADLVGCVTQRAFLFLIVKLIKYFIKLKLKCDRVGINLVRSPSL